MNPAHWVRGLPVGALLLICGALPAQAAGLNPDALTVADFAFMQGAD